ncbi:MAG TPA: hypothetical protein RMH99_32670 [Sandaracinaceae bacterium LLY-WYZ-13_1]|nr:hypothetical protein [Sandaracinaceae bacterium LLY-WYZ-13_1]
MRRTSLLFPAFLLLATAGLGCSVEPAAGPGPDTIAVVTRFEQIAFVGGAFTERMRFGERTARSGYTSGPTFFVARYEGADVRWITPVEGAVRAPDGMAYDPYDDVVAAVLGSVVLTFDGSDGALLEAEGVSECGIAGFADVVYSGGRFVGVCGEGAAFELVTIDPLRVENRVATRVYADDARPVALAADAGGVFVIGELHGDLVVGTWDGREYGQLRLVSQGDNDDVFLLQVRTPPSAEGELRDPNDLLYARAGRVYGHPDEDDVAVDLERAHGSIYAVSEYLDAFELDGLPVALGCGHDPRCDNHLVARFDDAPERGSFVARWVRAFTPPVAHEMKVVAISAAADTVGVTGRFEGTLEVGEETLTSEGGTDVLLALLSADTGDVEVATSAGGRGDDRGRDLAIGGPAVGFAVGALREEAVFPKVRYAEDGSVVVEQETHVSAGDTDGFVWTLPL